MAKQRKFQCQRYRGIKKSTLKKESCDQLYDRLECYGLGHFENVEGNRVRNTIIPYIQGDTSTYTNLGMALTHTFDTLLEKNCPKITTDQLQGLIENDFPNHRFKIVRNKIQIPRTFTQEEFDQLQKKSEYSEESNFTIQYNEKTDRYYLLPKRISPLTE